MVTVQMAVVTMGFSWKFQGLLVLTDLFCPVHMYVHMYICTDVHTYVRTYVCINNTCTYVCTYIMSVCVCVCACVRVCVRVTCFHDHTGCSSTLWIGRDGSVI